MKTIKYFILITTLLYSLGLKAQNNESNTISWDGYMQVRFTSDFSDINSFALRRLKFWIKTTSFFDSHLGFKLQTTLSSKQNEKFFLQDVEGFYKVNHFKLNFGQFVPHYSLERFQTDFNLPLTERSEAINNIIPDGTLGVRDIGIEGNYTSPGDVFETWLGIFNGNGIKEYKLNNSGIMVTNRTELLLFDHRLETGFSLMYRKADHLKLSNVLPDSVTFTGDDFRYNLFAMFRSNNFRLQGEYLSCYLNNEVSNGYYILSSLDLSRSQFVASWNRYNDLIDTTYNFPVIHFGYNYQFNKKKLKIMCDNSLIIRDNMLNNYRMTIQIQLFFK